jgi:Domain of unknown function (DUF5076)
VGLSRARLAKSLTAESAKDGKEEKSLTAKNAKAAKKNHNKFNRKNAKTTPEILRVWGGANLPQQYALNTTWDDPGALGLLLVDIARHAAKAYGTDGRVTEQAALSRIKQMLDAEWDSPTDEPKQLG